MNDLEHKVARAIDPGAFTETGRKKTARRLFAVSAAQAALKAHAEHLAEQGLTEEMKLAGARSLRDSFGWTNQSERASACWQAMISAALQDSAMTEIQRLGQEIDAELQQEE